MAAKKTGISRDLIIHPGETIADVLEERGITQAELAAHTGVSPAYISNVISGKKDISTKFAMGLEYALGVPKSFWLNLQANYNAELLEINEEQTITEDENDAYNALGEVIKYLRKKGSIPAKQGRKETILSLRKALKISSIANLQTLVPEGAFRLASKTAVDPYVLGAWLRLCQNTGEQNQVLASTGFDIEKTEELIADVKTIMLKTECDLQQELMCLMRRYGIDFAVVKNFKGAPVHGYISQKKDGIFQMTLTIRGSFADIFWFSLFHELGHIVNGDVSRGTKFIDGIANQDTDRERAADTFACNALLNPESYITFVDKGDFSINAISKYAATQNVMPYIVIGRLQKEERIPYTWHSKYKLRYKWA